jgi:hypothetical protein
MRIITSIAAAAAFLLPAAALAEEGHVRRDGVDATYSSTKLADGSVLITGHDAVTDRDFRLVVLKGRVTGEVGSERVAFTAPPVRIAAR